MAEYKTSLNTLSQTVKKLQALLQSPMGYVLGVPHKTAKTNERIIQESRISAIKKSDVPTRNVFRLHKYKLYVIYGKILGCYNTRRQYFSSHRHQQKKAGTPLQLDQITIVGNVVASLQHNTHDILQPALAAQGAEIAQLKIQLEESNKDSRFVLQSKGNQKQYVANIQIEKIIDELLKFSFLSTQIPI